ncbi:sphingosine-1-phosphate phosphatase 2-like isoform X2 [Rhinoraja longicauda]
MSALLAALRAPELVAQFQRQCGLVPLSPQRPEQPEQRRWPQGQADTQQAAGALPARPRARPLDAWSQQAGGDSNGAVTRTAIPQKKYKIENYFLYYLFLFAATLGQEVFYITFLPFCYWNIDPHVARRVINVWAVVMYIGQTSKDVLRWPRPPSPPVIKLEVRVDAEYGMPSTHAMAATAIPFTFLLATMNRYKYPFELALVFAVAICTLVSLSRIYTGMHTVLDVLCGIAITAVLVTVSYPLWDAIEAFQMKNHFAPVLALTLSFLLAINYPELDHWSTARGDTTNIVSAGGGATLATWINYQWHLIPDAVSAPPYEMPSLTTELICRMGARFVIGIVIVFFARQAIKSVALAFVCKLAGVSPDDKQARKLLWVEVPYKYITYTCLGVVGLALCPAVHRYLSL